MRALNDTSQITDDSPNRCRFPIRLYISSHPVCFSQTDSNAKSEIIHVCAELAETI